MNKTAAKLIAFAAIGVLIASWAVNNVDAIRNFVAPKPPKA